MEITVIIPDEGKRVLESWLGVGQIQLWCQHAIDNKLRQRIDASIREATAWNPAKMKQDVKLAALKTLALPSKEERDGLIRAEEKKKEK